jgi:DEAD/DEAH box helicase domain-containing protein
LGRLWPILERADRIIGFNIFGFDLPIMNNYYPGNLMKFPALDLMKEIENDLGHRVSLNDVAQGSLGAEKSGDGLQAIRLWNEGRLDELKDYCLQDVKLTKEVYEYGKKNNFVKYISRIDSGQAKVDFSMPEDVNKVNLTLPI